MFMDGRECPNCYKDCKTKKHSKLEKFVSFWLVSSISCLSWHLAPLTSPLLFGSVLFHASKFANQTWEVKKEKLLNLINLLYRF